MRILVVRDPLQNYLSIHSKPFCNNCGGFLSRLAAVDTIFARLSASAAKAEQLQWDAVLFAEDLAHPTHLRRLLGRLLGEQHVSASSAPRATETPRDWVRSVVSRRHPVGESAMHRRLTSKGEWIAFGQANNNFAQELLAHNTALGYEPSSWQMHQLEKGEMGNVHGGSPYQLQQTRVAGMPHFLGWTLNVTAPALVAQYSHLALWHNLTAALAETPLSAADRHAWRASLGLRCDGCHSPSRWLPALCKEQLKCSESLTAGCPVDMPGRAERFFGAPVPAMRSRLRD